MQALILGCGYLGRRVAQLWLGREEWVTVVTRSRERAGALAEAGFQTCVADVTDAESLRNLPTADVALYAVGYDRNSNGTRDEVIIGGLRNALAVLADKTRRLVFISTSSVYGTADGGWVDEATPTEPGTESGRLALAAEQLVRESSLAVIQLRLTGLYGPGRLLRRIEQLERREPIAGASEAWLNLIHMDDAARAVVIAADRLLEDRDAPQIGETYLVTDDMPLRRQDYYAMLARVAGAPAPIFDPTASGSRISGLGKRCRNDRVKKELGLALEYPRVTEELLNALVRNNV